MLARLVAKMQKYLDLWALEAQSSGAVAGAPGERPRPPGCSRLPLGLSHVFLWLRMAGDSHRCAQPGGMRRILSPSRCGTRGAQLGQPLQAPRPVARRASPELQRPPTEKQVAKRRFRQPRAC